MILICHLPQDLWLELIRGFTSYFCVTQMRPHHMKAKNPLTVPPYIDFWAVTAYPYVSLPQIVPKHIKNFNCLNVAFISYKLTMWD